MLLPDLVWLVTPAVWSRGPDIVDEEMDCVIMHSCIRGLLCLLRYDLLGYLFM